MKAMKFRVLSPEHSEAIQKKLFEMGYGWNGQIGKTEYLDAGYLYAGYFGGMELTYTYRDSDFDDLGKYNCQEHFLFNGQFVTADYFKQPVTENTPKEETPTPQPEEPAIFVSREIHDQARMKYIAKCLVKTLEAGNRIPKEWLDELYDLQDRQEGL